MSSVHDFHKRFRKRGTSLQHDPVLGQAHRALTNDVIAQIGGLILENIQVCFTFLTLVERFWGYRFHPDEKVKERVRLWIHQQTNSFDKNLSFWLPIGINVLTQ